MENEKLHLTFKMVENTSEFLNFLSKRSTLFRFLCIKSYLSYHYTSTCSNQLKLGLPQITIRFLV